MTSKERLDYYDETFSGLRKLLEGKNNDYGSDGDALQNFYRVSHMAHVLNVDTRTPEGYCMFMVLLKIDRICNLCFPAKQAVNEAVADSCDDLLGYSFLFKCILNNNQKNQKDEHTSSSTSNGVARP